MPEKQGKENFKFIKDDKDNTDSYLLKKNRITLIAIGVIGFLLIMIVLAIFFFGDSFI